MELALEQSLPPLREDLRLFRGARDWDGAPNWVIFDPLRNSYFQIGEREFHLLRHWDAGEVGRILESAGYGGDDDAHRQLEELADFLVGSQLLRGQGRALRRRLAETSRERDQPLWKKVLHGYLFFRYPLVRPDRFLDWLYPRVRFLFSRTFLRVSLAVGLLGIILVMQRWEDFVTSFPWFFSAEGMAVFALTLVTVKILHELGHALACKRYGLNVPTMGIAFIVMWPVLYTDASDAWRLRRRRQRAFIDAAGVSTELLLACYATLFWVFLPEGLARGVAFAVATTTWVLSVVVNLNPFMRFDGYYFLSDILNVPNLQQRSFELGRWRLRTWLFGAQSDPPEQFPPRLQTGLIWFAFGVWVYRFFLFLGIALLVYHFFFKALGVVLFLVEIWWFILRPLVNEFRLWKGLWPRTGSRRKAALAGSLLALLILVVWPWQREILVPAEMASSEFTRLYPSRAARVEEVLAAEGDNVRAGDPLVRLSSPRLLHELELARLEIERLQGALQRGAMGDEGFSERLVLERQLAEARSQRQALERQSARLAVKAPQDGVVRDLNRELHEGRWITDRFRLLTVVSGEEAAVTAWVREEDIRRIIPGSRGWFFAANSHGPMDSPLTLREIGRSAVALLENPYQASVFGGDLPVRRDQQGRLVPEVALYRADLRREPREAPGQRLRGWVRLPAGRESLAGEFWRWVAGTLIRESGF